jgi:hypothetical protein
MARFEVASDFFDQEGNNLSFTQGATVAVPAVHGNNYLAGDLITMSGGNAAAPTVLQVQAIDSGGGPIAVNIFNPGRYITPPSNPVSQASTTGGGIGFEATLTYALSTVQQVILTQQEFALLNYTFTNPPESIWDAMFEDTMVSALAARLAQALTGDKALARDKITIANANIQNARGVDGNEGLTINDHIPDWIRVRGVGGALGYEAFFYPLGPLFPVAPLV